MTQWQGRVALVLGTSTGGIGAHVADLARGLAAGGAEVTVCGPAELAARFDTVGVTFSPVRIVAGAAHPAHAVAVATLGRVLAAVDPEVVHAHGLRAGLVAAFAVKRRPLVVTWHNAVITRGLRGGASRLAERIVAKAADVTLAASGDLAARASAVGAPDVRLAPIAAPLLPPPTRDRATVRAELGVDADTPLVLSVGRLHPQKGYDVLVSAAARWRDLRPRPAVVIAGQGPSHADLAARIAATGAPVTLLGHRDDVADLLAAADLAVVTSVWEARQLFAQEAMRAGVPLVATAVGGLPDLVGDAAVLVPPGDVDAVDREVRRLLDRPQDRARYARRGAERAATWPTPEETLDQVRSVYAEVVAAAAAGRRRRRAVDG